MIFLHSTNKKRIFELFNVIINGINQLKRLKHLNTVPHRINTESLPIYVLEKIGRTLLTEKILLKRNKLKRN